MRSIAIFGVGLIGGSFGLAMRKAGFPGEILGVSSEAAIETALRRGAITRRASAEEAASEADLIYFSQPVDVILQSLAALSSWLQRDCLVTDAGSTKRMIVEIAQQHIPAGHFLGGHPMAGKELRGIAQADADLFLNRPYVLTPLPEGDGPRPFEITFRSWLERIGARVIDMTPEEHDRAVAFTSHLPQVLSTSLAMTLQQNRNRDFTRIFGTGLLDMTRLARSAPELWLSILATNKTEVSSAIDAFIKVLTTVQDQLGREELQSTFAAAQEFSALLRK